MRYKSIRISVDEAQNIINRLPWKYICQSDAGYVFWNSETGELIWTPKDTRMKAQYSKLNNRDGYSNIKVCWDCKKIFTDETENVNHFCHEPIYQKLDKKGIK